MTNVNFTGLDLREAEYNLQKAIEQVEYRTVMLDRTSIWAFTEHRSRVKELQRAKELLVIAQTNYATISTSLNSESAFKRSEIIAGSTNWTLIIVGFLAVGVLIFFIFKKKRQ